MKNLLLLLFYLGIFSSNLFSQDSIQEPKIKRHSFYSELGGSSGLCSVNYDYRLQLSDNVSVLVGTGTGFMYVISDIKSHGTAFLTPCANLLIGKTSHHVELGGSIQACWDGILMPTGRIGYRYQPKNGGSLFRIAFTPIFGVSEIYPWAGISFGYTF